MWEAARMIIGGVPDIPWSGGASSRGVGDRRSNGAIHAAHGASCRMVVVLSPVPYRLECPGP